MKRTDTRVVPCLDTSRAVAGGVATVALRAAALGVQAAVICTINPGLDILSPALPLTTTSNGAIVSSGVVPIVAVQPAPFVGTFTVTYPAEPGLQCPGEHLRQLISRFQDFHTHVVPS